MTLSFNKLNEIAELYESIAASEQEQLDEAPMTAFQAGGGNAQLAKLNKGRSPRAGRATASTIERQGQDNLYKAGGGDAAIAKGPTTTRNVRGGGTQKVPTLTRQDIINRGSNAAAKTATPKPTAPKPAPSAAAKPQPSAAAKPPATTPKVLPTKPAAATPAKPAMGTTAGGTKFERRAATSAELKAAQDARAAAKAAGNTKGAEEAAVKAGVAAGKSTLKQSFEYDAYDLVLEYLLSQGHAETVAEAQYLMTEMDAEMIGDIVESYIR